MIVLDGLKVAQNTRLLELFTENEDILYSGELIKINKNKRKQKRNIVITTESIYNLRPDNLVTSALNIFKKGALIKRRIPIDSIRAIVYARLGNEFIIHVPEEFDYRIYHPQYLLLF